MENTIDILLFDEEETTQILIENYLKELTFNYNLQKFSEFSIKLLPQDFNTRFIIININQNNKRILTEVQKASKDKNNIIIIISYDNSADLHVLSMRFGAKEFLIKPLIKNDFVNSLQKLLNIAKNEKNKANDCVTYTVISVGKETGKTFFALNLAKDVSDNTDKNVLLVDFNNNLNDLSSRIFMDFPFNTAKVINEANKENFNFKANIQKYPESKLYVLANGVFCNDASINMENLNIFIDKIRNDFKYVFLDLNAEIASNSAIVNSVTDIIYFILEPNLQMAQETKMLRDRSYPLKRVRYIINKYNPRKDSELLKQLEYILGQKVFALIPKNFMATNSSIAHYKTLSELTPNVDVAQKYKQMANFITGKD